MVTTGIGFLGRFPTSDADARVYSKPAMWVTGDMADPGIFTPVSLQEHSYGRGSVLTLDMNCRADEIGDHIQINDRVELWVRVGRTDVCRFRGRFVDPNYRGDRGKDGASIVCIDATHEMDDDTVFWEVGDVTAAVIIKGLFEGYTQYGFYNTINVPVIPRKIDPTVCELGDDLAILDTKKINVSFTGQGVMNCISQVFNRLGGKYIWWIEPNQNGTNSLLRFCERGQGPARFLTARGTDYTDIAEWNGSRAYSGIRNSIIGLGAPRRYQRTSLGPDDSNSVALVKDWSQGSIDETASIEAEVLEKPSLVAKKGVYEHVGRRFVLDNSIATWKNNEALFGKLKADYVSFDASAGTSQFTDPDLQLWVSYDEAEAPEGQTEDEVRAWQPYQGAFKLFWEKPVATDLRTRTTDGVHQFRPWSRQLPNRVVVSLEQPALYDKYQLVRTVDNADEYPEPARTSFPKFALTYSYQERSQNEATGNGRLQVKTGHLGPFPRERKFVKQDETKIYENISAMKPTFSKAGIPNGTDRTSEIRDDSAGFREVLNDMAEQSSAPEHQFSFELNRWDGSMQRGDVVTRINGLTGFEDIALIVQTIVHELGGKATMKIQTSDRLEMVL